MEILLKRFLLVSVILTVMISLVLAFSLNLWWALGLSLGGFWSILNILLTVQILKNIIGKKDLKKMLPSLLVKIPFIYFLAFLVFYFRMLPSVSIVAGVFITVMTIGVVSVCPKAA
jgi:hypothetical protein